MQAQEQTTTIPASPFRFSRKVVRLYTVLLIAGGGYLASLLSAGRLTAGRFLLPTAIYGAWMGIYYLGARRSEWQPLWWEFTLFCLACASQFISLSNTNLNWLPILPTTTACLLAANTPRLRGLVVAGALWLSSSLAFSLSMHRWDLNTQLTLLVSFSAFVGMSVVIRELAHAHFALESSNAELAAAHIQLREYSAQVEEMAAIRERNRIAREIHDTLGHSLTLLAVQLETATQIEARGDPGLHAELLEARRVAKACLTDVRHSVEALRPDDARAGSLQARLRTLAAEFATTSRETAITVDLDEATQPLNADLSMTLYRCAQEALTNVRKHARATKVLLYLGVTEGPEAQAELSVLDNGQGSAAGSDERASGFGILGMRERVALVGGMLRAGPEPGHGWRVEVVIPLIQRAQAEAIAQTSRGTGDEG